MIETNDTDQREVKEARGQYDDTSDAFNQKWANLKRARNHFAKSRSNTKEAYDFVAGRQLSEEDMLLLQEQGRPVVCFNRTVRAINAISGLEVQSRQEPNCYPVEVNDNGFGEYATNVLRWVRQKNDAEDEDSEAFRDCSICGYGWTEVYILFEGMQPDIYTSRVDPLEMLYDPSSKKSNCVDARWIARVKDLTRQEFVEEFPGEDFMPYSFWGSDASDSEPHDAQNAWRYENDQSDRLGDVKTCSVIQYQYWEKEKFYTVVGPDGKAVELSKAKFKVMKDILISQGYQIAEYEKKVYKQCVLSKNKVLKENVLTADRFTFQAITGYHDVNENVFFGMVMLMMDPQRWANKWLSQVMHIVNSGAKNGLIVEKGAVSNPRQLETEWSKPGSVTVVNPGALSEGKIQPKVAPAYPDGIDRLLNYAMSAIQDVVGVSLELIGMADRDQPIGLEESRKKAGVTMLATFFDSLRRYRKNNARVLMSYIREYLPEGTLVRITGQQGAQYVPLLKDKLAFDFDIIVDDAPTSTNMKERVFAVLSQFLPMALQSGIPIPPEILDYSPLPEALVQKWKSMIQKGQQDPMQQQMKQMQMANAQVDLQQKQTNIQKTQSDVVVNYAKAEQARATGQDEQAQAMQKMGMEQQIKQQEFIAEQQRKDYEMLMNQQRRAQDAEISRQQKQQMYEQNMAQRQMNTFPV